MRNYPAIVFQICVLPLLLMDSARAVTHSIDSAIEAVCEGSESGRAAYELLPASKRDAETRLIAKATELFKIETRTEAQEQRLLAVLHVLGAVGDTDSAKFLLTHLDYVSSIHMQEIRTPLPWHRYPALTAVLEIGGKALPDMVRSLAETDDSARIQLIRLGCFAIIWNMYEMQPGSKAVANKLVATYIDASASVEREDRKERLKASCEYFRKLGDKIPETSVTSHK